MKILSLLPSYSHARRSVNRRREIWFSFVFGPRIPNQDCTLPQRGLCCLEKGEVTVIERPLRDELIQCRKGRLWITQTGGDRDTILTSGESFKTCLEGRLVIEALEDALFTQCPMESDPTGY
jgi:hypothetical protein